MRNVSIIGTDGKQLPDTAQVSERQSPKGPIAYYKGDFYQIIGASTPRPSIDLRYPVTAALS